MHHFTPNTVTRLRNSLARLATEIQSDETSAIDTGAQPPPFSSISSDDWIKAVRLWRDAGASTIAGLADRACPACGSSRSRKLFDSYDGYPYHECGPCGCWFIPKHVDWRLFERFFEACPSAAALAAEMMASRDTDARRAADMDRIGSYLDRLQALSNRDANGVHYLDMGCGVGHSLRAARLRGFAAVGIEADAVARELGHRDGLHIIGPDEKVPDGRFNLISLWETLEHLPSPLDTLSRCVSLLEEDGLIAITVPNLNALEARVLRESCPWIHGGYNTPGHLNLFHPPAIERLFHRAGLTLIDVDTQFSSNPLELFHALAGISRGAFDLIDDTAARITVSSDLSPMLTAVWPGVALIERAALAGPILWAVACRRGRESRFAGAIQSARAQREAEVQAAASRLLGYEADYEEISADLDRQLSELRQKFESEIHRYDTESQQTISELQHQVNLRDQLLEATRRKTVGYWIQAGAAWLRGVLER